MGNDNHRIELRTSSNLCNVALLGAAIRAYCLNFEIRETCIQRIELACVEAINNVIVHGYKSCPDHTIDVVITMHTNSLTVIVSDNGLPMPLSVVNRLCSTNDSDAFTDPLTYDEIPESGWGINIVRSLCKQVKYQQESSCNILTLEHCIIQSNADVISAAY